MDVPRRLDVLKCVETRVPPIAVVASVLLALVLAGCDGRDGNNNQADSPTGTATPTGTAARTSASTPTAASSTSTEEPGGATPEAHATHPDGTRTGVADIDAVIAALESSDASALNALLRYSDVPCVVGSAGRFPVCPPGAAGGTPVKAIRETRCEGGWIPDTVDLADTTERFVAGEWRVFAVARLPAPTRSVAEGGPPPGDYLVVFEHPADPGGEPRAVVIGDGGVLQLSTGCYFVTPSKWMDDFAIAFYGFPAFADFVLPPLR